MVKFNINSALEGKPVLLRNGRKGYIRYVEFYDTFEPFLGYVDGVKSRYKKPTLGIIKGSARRGSLILLGCGKVRYRRNKNEI